jgi:hypothetical protein
VALWALGFFRAPVRAGNGGCGSGSSFTVSALGAGSGYSDLIKHKWNNVDLGGDTLIQTVVLELIDIGAM